MAPAIGRRRMIAGAAVCLAGCDPSHPKRGFLGMMMGWNDRVQGAVLSPEGLAPAPRVSAQTPMSAFPAYKIGADYPRPPPGWTLEVGGMVERPRRFRLEELQRLPRTDMRVRHHCVEGWTAVADWHGVRVRDVADAVGAARDSRYVEFTSFEITPGPSSDLGAHDPKNAPNVLHPPSPTSTYSSSWDRASALHPQSILAYGMNGADLTLLHGGPLRLYSSIKLGYKMVKWLIAVRFLAEPTGGYWEDMGYDWFAGV
jgi:DMSO/TMAO reductase YedYZ molybdopterin-dependent catalytic subunit